MGIQYPFHLCIRELIRINIIQNPAPKAGFFFLCAMKNIISLIVAMAEDYAIGKDNNLMWHIKDDLRLFMKTTNQHVVIHGRKSYESIGKALPNRSNIIISRDANYKAPGSFVVNSLENALALAAKLEQKGEVFILGGAQIYAQSFAVVDRMYISHVKASFPEAHVHFPSFDDSAWKKVSSTHFPKNEVNEFAFEFAVYERC